MTPTASANTVVAVFDDYTTAQNAMQELRNAGIPENEISIQSNFKTSNAGYGGSESSTQEHEGGFMAWWHRTFGSDEEDEYSGHYAEAVRRGSAVVTVTADKNTLDSAVKVLNTAGAVDIDRRVQDYRSTGYNAYDASASAYDYDTAIAERSKYANSNPSTNQGTVIPVVEEELQIGKRQVQRGGVRVYSKIVERPVDEQVNLREEHVRVDRRPVDRAVTSAELTNLKDQSIEVTEIAEEAVISKQARVREEVVIGKEATERTQQVHDTVKKTEVTVDQIDPSRTYEPKV